MITIHYKLTTNQHECPVCHRIKGLDSFTYILDTPIECEQCHDKFITEINNEKLNNYE